MREEIIVIFCTSIREHFLDYNYRFGYGENEFGYRFYDPVEKKPVRSGDMKFMEDQTIEDIDKVEKSTPKEDNGVVDFKPVQSLIQNLNTDVQNDVGVQQPGDKVDVPVDDD